jgi:hypothetical protein
LKAVDQEGVAIGRVSQSFVHLPQATVEYTPDLVCSVRVIHDVVTTKKFFDLHQHSLEEFDMEQCLDVQRIRVDSSRYNEDFPLGVHLSVYMCQDQDCQARSGQSGERAALV